MEHPSLPLYMTGFVRFHSATRLLLTIAASYGLGAALDNTGVDTFLAVILSRVGAAVGALPFLHIVFLLTAALSCVVSNAATVVLLYSVLIKIEISGVRLEQLMLVMMLGASSAFATPIGYQTNLMVLTAGGYRFSDFFKLGATLTVSLSVVVCTITWLLPEGVI